MNFHLYLLLTVGMLLIGMIVSSENEHRRIEKRQAGSCVHPPNAFLKRMACIGSCAFQNCATGYCAGRTCKCSRCNSGPVRGGKKRSISESENTTDLKVFACDSSCARQNCSMGLYDGETCECTQCEHNQRID